MINSAPTKSAKFSTPSVEPPSVRINSRTNPASKPSIKDSMVSRSFGVAFRVGMMTEIGARMCFPLFVALFLPI